MKPSNQLSILAIDTSCDDTCIAILKIENWKLKILSNIISSQVRIHRKYGGVYPTLARREHQKNLVPVLKRALKKANLLKKSKTQISNFKQIPKSKFQILEKILKREKIFSKELKKFLKSYQKPKINLIAVTIGPGLEPCLWVGVNFAKALAFYWNLPLIPVNHIKAHILVNFVNKNFQFSISTLRGVSRFARSSNFQKMFPAICLIVSGGHTQLILMKDFYNFKIIGETRDDAAGECFDKTARILGLEYPGGPAIEEQAQAAKLQTTNYPLASTSSAGEWRAGKLQTELPRPMIYQKNFDFSFSGLKTAVLYKVKNQELGIRNQEFVQEMAVEIQQAIIDVLIKKTIRAAKEYKAKSIILGGGVAANKELRRQLNYKLQTTNYKLNFLVPPKKFCTDNAAMIGIAGFYGWLKGKTKNWSEIEAKANLRIS